jgi:two-component system sensor histidine kinase/response regulator
VESVRGLRVLIVDDDRSAQEILYRYMIDWDISATVVSSATEAMTSLRERSAANMPYDIAIIDYAMPDVTGIELAERIKADPDLRKVGLVMVTAYDGAKRGEAAIAAGYSSYLPKPVRHAQLFDCVAKAVGALDDAATGRGDGSNEHTVDVVEAAARPERILLVEDQPVNQRLVVQQLKKLGFAARAVANGQLALNALAYERFDLVLMDCHMPVMDGFEATRMIRKSELHTGRRVPIVAMTANARREDREACLGAGMDDYLAKPVMIDQIRAKIATWLPTLEVVA